MVRETPKPQKVALNIYKQLQNSLNSDSNTQTYFPVKPCTTVLFWIYIVQGIASLIFFRMFCLKKIKVSGALAKLLWPVYKPEGRTQHGENLSRLFPTYSLTEVQPNSWIFLLPAMVNANNSPKMPRLSSKLASYHSADNSKGKSRFWKTTTDTFQLFCIFFMLVWPWAFFGTVWALHGIPMNSHIAQFVTEHPHSTDFFFVTFIGTIVRLIVGYLFSKAVLRLCQEWMTDDYHFNLFHISIISGLRNQKLPWGLGDMWHLRRQLKWSRIALVAACWGTFIVIPSGVTSLLGPVPFDRTVPLEGTELDFSSASADCIAWLNTQTIPNTCDWAVSLIWYIHIYVTDHMQLLDL